MANFPYFKVKIFFETHCIGICKCKWKEAFSLSEYFTWMSLIDSIPEKWKVAVKVTNDVTDYRINLDLYNCIPQKKVYQVFLKKVLIPPTAKKMNTNRHYAYITL